MPGRSAVVRFPSLILYLPSFSRTVRSRAARALGRLMGMNPKVDPLVIDLVSSVQASEGGVKEATLSALRGVLKHAGKSVSAGAYAKLVPPLRELLGAEEDEFRGLAARTLGALSDVRSTAFVGSVSIF